MTSSTVTIPERLLPHIDALDEVYGETRQEKLDSILTHFFTTNALSHQALKRLPGRSK